MDLQLCYSNAICVSLYIFQEGVCWTQNRACSKWLLLNGSCFMGCLGTFTVRNFFVPIKKTLLLSFAPIREQPKFPIM